MTKVLVVEDIPLNMELVIEILYSQGFTVDKAEDGKEAVTKAEKEVYDLIFMDIGLPNMDGIEAARLIKNKPGYEDIPIIALTAFAMKGDKERLISAGFNDYISKPIGVSEFVRRLEKYRK